MQIEWGEKDVVRELSVDVGVGDVRALVEVEVVEEAKDP